VNGSVGIAFPNVKALPDLLITPTARVQYLQQDNNFRFASGSQLAVSNVEDLQNSQQAQLHGQRDPAVDAAAHLPGRPAARVQGALHPHGRRAARRQLDVRLRAAVGHLRPHRR
jgi:hypothetical protein